MTIITDIVWILRCNIKSETTLASPCCMHIIFRSASDHVHLGSYYLIEFDDSLLRNGVFQRAGALVSTNRYAGKLEILSIGCCRIRRVSVFEALQNSLIHYDVRASSQLFGLGNFAAIEFPI